MSNVTDLITACKEWPADMEKIEQLIKGNICLNFPVIYERCEYRDPLLAVIMRYPSLSIKLNKEYRGIEYHDIYRQISFFESYRISNKYLFEIIKLFIENGYDIHADEGMRAATILASLYYWTKYMDSYIFDAARLIINEEPRVLDVVRTYNPYDCEEDNDKMDNLKDEQYEACTLYGWICWHENDCVVPDHCYPRQHQCTAWRKLLETGFAGKDPSVVDYYDRLYGQKILDIIIPDCSLDTRSGRKDQYSIDEDILLICENDFAVIDKCGSLYIDNSVKYDKRNQTELPSSIKGIIGQTILSAESRQHSANSDKYRTLYSAYELVIRLSNNMNLIVTDKITSEEKALIENETDNESSYHELMEEIWNRRIMVQ